MTVNRYQDILNVMPKGQDFDSDGEVLPFRDAPYTFEFSTSKLNRLFQVYLNDVVQQSIITHPSTGTASVTTIPALPPGEYILRIEDPQDGEVHYASFTIRISATFQAALADVLEETQDDEIDLMEQALSIETVTSKYIESVYGRRVRQSWPDNFLLDDYRNLLIQLRTAYRHFGAMKFGMEQVVEAYLSSAPLIVSRRWRPRWVLGADAAIAGTDTQVRARTDSVLHAPAGATAASVEPELANINRQSRYYVHAGVTGTVSGAASFRQPPTPQRLTVTIADANAAILSGVDETGTAFTETVPDPAITPAAGTWESQRIFTSITQAQKTGSAAQIGLADSRFIRITDIGVYNTEATAGNVIYGGYTSTVPPLLQLGWVGGTLATFDLDETGPITLRNPNLAPHVIGVRSTATTFDLNPLASADTQDYHDRLHFDIDERGPISVDVGGGAATVTPANAVTAINNALNADPRYGASFNTSAYVLTGDLGFNQSVVAIRSPSYAADASVTILPGPCDAAPYVLGLGRMTTRTDTATVGTAIGCVVTDQMPDVLSTDPSPFRRRFDVRLRGKRSDLETGTTAGISGPNATLTSGGYTFVASDVGGYVRNLSASEPDNDGLHRIISVNAGVATLLHQDAITGGAFIAAADNEFVVYHPGEVVTVNNNNTATDTLTSLVAPTLTWPEGAIVEVVSDVPEHRDLVPGHATLTVEVDQTYRPHHDFGDSITMAGPTATLSSARAAFTVGMIGFDITISGCTNAENNGTFAITAVPTALTVEYTNGFGINETSNFEWAVNELPANVTDSITPDGNALPDGWRFVDPADTAAFSGNIGNAASNFNDHPGRMVTSRIHIVSDDADGIGIERNFPELLDFKGLPLDVAFWIQEHSASAEPYEISVSFDDGSSFFEVVTSTAAIASPFNASTRRGPQNPFSIEGQFYVPYDAETVILRLSRTNSGALTGYGFSWETLIVSSPTGTGLFCGDNTIPRSSKRAVFGELLYAWSPEELDDAEKIDLGLPLDDGSLPSRPGHIDYVSNAHGWWDRLEIGERDTSVVPLVRQNLRGAYDDVDWLAVETAMLLTQTEVVPGTPTRLTYVRPTRVSGVTFENLALFDGGDGPGTARANLAILSDHEGAFPQIPSSTARLYEIRSTESTLPGPNGLVTIIPAGTPIPVPNTIDENGVQPWQFTTGQQIRINSPYYNPAATYQIDYDVLMRAQTEEFQLSSAGIDQEDYVWLVDFASYKRFDVTESNKDRTEQLIFDATFRARIDERADSAAVAELLRDNGIFTETVPLESWRFEDSQTVKIDPAVFDANSIYTLTYSARVPDVASTVNFVIEMKSAASQGALAGAPWEEVELHQVVTPFHDTGDDATINNVLDWRQLRVTVTGVTDVRDFRIYGLGLRGVHLFGASAFAPGILTPAP